jgi:murein DD-endopeptidase MepM/ murein hydrolase activator NlpD
MSDPTTRRKLSVALCVAVVLGVPSSPASGTNDDANDLRAHRNEVTRRVEAAQLRLGEASDKLHRARVRLTTVRGGLRDALEIRDAVKAELRSAEERVRQFRSQLAVAERRLESAGADLAKSEAAREEQREALVDIVADLYQGTNPQFMTLRAYFTSSTVEDVAQQVEASRSVIDAQDREYQELQAAQILSSVRARQLNEAAQVVAERTQQAEQSVADLEVARTEAQAAAARVRASFSLAKQARQRAERIRRDDLQTLRRFQAMERRLRERIREQAQSQAQATADSHPVSGGRLTLPVDGVITSPFGYRMHPIYNYWGLHDGIDFGAPCGEALRASANGIVTRSYYSEVFGYRLFVDVGQLGGQSLTLIYNHAAGYSVSAGDAVTRGDIVGSVGDSGWSTGCHLHFTVLADGKPVDPDNFF